MRKFWNRNQKVGSPKWLTDQITQFGKRQSWKLRAQSYTDRFTNAQRIKGLSVEMENVDNPSAELATPEFFPNIRTKAASASLERRRRPNHIIVNGGSSQEFIWLGDPKFRLSQSR
mmetsp:Transcript_29273/g.44098  ORF Transcript_29273/g.44098 Transcript_29273/m.44098 type:complete len:116 (-) Transcript_29273:1456-1803(-)